MAEVVAARQPRPARSRPAATGPARHDFEWIVTATAELLERGATEHRAVDVIKVPGGHPGFETVDGTDKARDAARRSIAWWA